VVSAFPVGLVEFLLMLEPELVEPGDVTAPPFDEPDGAGVP
jgi:hypothetical protein